MFAHFTNYLSEPRDRALITRTLAVSRIRFQVFPFAFFLLLPTKAVPHKIIATLSVRQSWPMTLSSPLQSRVQLLCFANRGRRTPRRPWSPRRNGCFNQLLRSKLLRALVYDVFNLRSVHKQSTWRPCGKFSAPSLAPDTKPNETVADGLKQVQATLLRLHRVSSFPGAIGSRPSPDCLVLGCLVLGTGTPEIGPWLLYKAVFGLYGSP